MTSFTNLARRLPVIALLLLGLCTTLEAAGAPPPPPPPEIAARTGEFLAGADRLTVYESDGTLFVDGLGWSRAPLRALDATSYEVQGASPGARVTFERDAQGRTQAVLAGGKRLARRDVGLETVAKIQAGTKRDPEGVRRAALAATPPVEPPHERAADLVDLTTVDPHVKLDIRYATSDNLIGFPVYERAAAFMQRPAAEALGRASRALALQGYGLLIHDAYRPWFVTKMFWDATPESAHMFVADPSQGSRHNRGCAVDLTLYDLKTGRAVEMTGRYDEMSPRSYPDYVGGTSRQRWFRALLRTQMERQGFKVYPEEWWHFDYQDWDKYAIGNATFEQLAGAAPAAGAPTPEIFAATDRIFQDYMLDAHVPGLAYGIVQDGRLVHVGTFGTQDQESKRPVSADTLFRIASMTKAFTALTVLALRDEGRLHLDALAEEYVPEMRGWKYPTADSPRVRVRDLLNHAAGFVTDDPWGDRQTPLPDADFSRLLTGGVPFTRAPETAFEYSNLGFALLGRIITNVSGAAYADTITRRILQPLGMTSSGFVADAAPRERRALGYRWEDDAWKLEPTLGPGAFGAMGGIQTSVNDYSRWVSFLLSGWPPRDEPESGPAKRATVRELAMGSNFPMTRARPGHGGDACRQAITYGMGMSVAVDCELGVTLGHGGGYPGYGSYVLLLPNRGAAIYAFASRTYAGPSAAVWDSAMALLRANALPREREIPVSAELRGAYARVAALYSAGNVAAAGDSLAMNFLLDRSAENWKRELKRLRSVAGECDTAAAIEPTGALTGGFVWRCTHGRLKGGIELAPTMPPRIQELTLEPAH